MDTLQVQGAGFTKTWKRGSTDISQIIHKAWGKVERDEAGKAGFSQLVMGFAC